MIIILNKTTRDEETTIPINNSAIINNASNSKLNIIKENNKLIKTFDKNKKKESEVIPNFLLKCLTIYLQDPKNDESAKVENDTLDKLNVEEIFVKRDANETLEEKKIRKEKIKEFKQERKNKKREFKETFDVIIYINHISY